MLGLQVGPSMWFMIHTKFLWKWQSLGCLELDYEINTLGPLSSISHYTHDWFHLLAVYRRSSELQVMIHFTYESVLRGVCDIIHLILQASHGAGHVINCTLQTRRLTTKGTSCNVMGSWLETEALRSCKPIGADHLQNCMQSQVCTFVSQGSYYLPKKI